MNNFIHGIKVTQTDTGSHGIHWNALFNEDVNKMERFVKAIETGKKLTVNDSLAVITDPLMRGVTYNDIVITGFPYLKGFSYEQFQINSIAEWSHAENLEAVIKVTHVSSRDISFFATDYAIHKNIYRTQKTLSINVVGLVYSLSEFNVQEWNQGLDKIKFSPDFCGYFPISEDEIEFTGRIEHMQEYSLGEIDGYLITVGITIGFSMECFVIRANLSTEPEINKSVCGTAWILGTLEK